MDNFNKLRQAFIDALGLTEDTDFATVKYSEIDEWDSIAHMALVAQLDDTFDIMLDTEDIIEISSLDKAVEVLSKYGVHFE
ncbi:phosphopantetheine-binding protein [Paenibacillus pabuli]|uniref:phosphopantetheine-binding protein n=1 Tax=Paenibacillus pabuli TaxID=1472 RepID=UPI000782650D|nr:phosphopantetheine-binding protein [Paenibacillus pabuli]MEC0129068.1 phosphopantetheine-binding protein [Paenibacillus pabuli]